MTPRKAATELDVLARELRLSSRERAFAELLVAAKPGTPRHEIAKAAGYKCKDRAGFDSSASETARKPKVQKYMQALALRAESVLALRTKQAVLGRAGVLRRLSAQADADVGRYLILGDDGEVEGFKIPKNQTRAIRAVKLKTRTIPGEDGSAPVLEREIELRVADPVPALRILAEHHKLVDGDDRADAKSVQVQVNLLLEQADPNSLRSAVFAELARAR